MGRFSDKTIAYAAERGIDEDELPLIVDGCSGGLSKLYRLSGKVLDCEGCCDLHDIDYQLGGTDNERKAADLRLRECAIAAVLNTNGTWGSMRRIWAKTRAWAMYWAVRLFGGSHWAGDEN